MYFSDLRAPASRTQTQTNTQPNMHSTHNPSPITRNLAEKHTFSAKERDTETGLSYFGARYYSSDLSIWLSVDPMSDKYPSLSPYVYCADNPVKFTDPDGNWIPGLDEDGNVTYTAEKGDNHDSFVKQFDTQGTSREIFKNAGLGIRDNDVNEGDVINGEAVKKATGCDVLKANWNKMNDNQKITQIMFALQYANYHNEWNGDDRSVDLSRFIADIPLSISFKPKSGKILLPKNKYIPIHFFEIDFSTLGNRQTLCYWSEGGGRFFTDSKGCNYYSYKYLSAKNPKARSKMTGLLLSIPASYSKEFEKRY